MNEKILAIYLVFGFFILLGYATVIAQSKNIWSNGNKNNLNGKMINFYKLMIILSFVAGSYLVYYLTDKQSGDNTSEILTHVGSLLFLAGSIIWAYNPFYKYINAVLGIVFVASILILAGICVDSNDYDPVKIVAIIATCIIVLQTGLFDFGLWTGILYLS